MNWVNGVVLLTGTDIGIAAMAIGFTVLAVYGVLGLRSIKAAADQARRTMMLVERQMEELAHESRAALRSVSLAADRANEKLRQLDSMFQAMDDIGWTARQAGSSFRRICAAVEKSVKCVQQSVHTNQRKCNDMTEWMSMAVRLLHIWQTHRSTQSCGQEQYDYDKGADSNGKGQSS